MTQIQAHVKIDLSGLQKYGKQIDAQLQHKETGHITACFKKWTARYRSFLKERFDTFSKGGGNWPQLSDVTKERRRGPDKKRQRKTKNFKRKFAILRDTGTLFAALSPTADAAPGALNANIPFGIRVGYGGNQRYEKGKQSKATIADIAEFHQVGNSRLPKREIIVPPPPHVVNLMADDLNTALQRIARDNEKDSNAGG